MNNKTTVVTPQRFAQGYVYADYLGVVKVNKNRFNDYYTGLTVDPAEAERFRALAARPGGPAKVVAIGEDWCPDVYRGLPTMARLADCADVEVRVFPRDSNQDVMQEFLKEGKYQSIPAFVFYTEGLDYICHWIERPKQADRETVEIEEAIRAENPGITDREFGILRRNRVAERFPDWQRATIKEINDMLEAALGG